MSISRLLQQCALVTLLFNTTTVMADEEPAGAPPNEGPAENEIDPTAEGTDDVPVADEAAKEKGRMHFRMGVDFYREGNYPAALVEFKRAYDAAPHYKLKFNLGQTSLELQDYAYAIDNLIAYLKEGGDEVPEDRRKLVEDMIEQLDARLAMVTISSNQEGAEIYVDDRLIGRTPFPSPVPIGAGRRRVVAIKEGYVTVEKRLDLAARDRIDLVLDFEDRPEAAPVIVTKVVDEGISPALWVGIGTGVLAAGAGTLTLLTLVSKQQYDTERRGITTEPKLDSLRKRTETRALLTDIVLGATGVAAVVTALLLLTGGDEEADMDVDAEMGIGSARLMPQLALGQDHTELGLSGHF